MFPSKEDFFNALAEKHGLERQKKFAAAKVAVCGLGGLGSNIAIALARAGVGRLHLIDFDRIEITNLNRQQYFPEQIGLFKADAMKENLSHIAPYCEITSQVAEITCENVEELLAGFPIVCEAFDKAEAKAALVDAVMEKLPGSCLVSGSGMAGFESANLIKTRKITSKFYICGDMSSDAGSGIGLYPPRVLACAAHQAHTILRIIAGEFEC
ncbi:sulfur carrier protein ThiS adenylyltransferase ThiF [bacterium]|nr:sulfur carrier protein ThiS adenylyltransferase ThiF [bacterium]